MLNALEALRDKNILVTGASGYIGTALLEEMAAIPCRILALSRRPYVPAKSATKAAVSAVTCDLTDAEAWTEPLLRGKPDFVFHLAAYEHRRGSAHAPRTDWETNAASTLNLLEACRKLGSRPKIVFTSSANLAGVPDRLPVDETFPDRPCTLYAIHKLAAERYLQHYAVKFGIPGSVLRFANVYGPQGSALGEVGLRPVLNRMMQQAVATGSVSLLANRKCRRDFVYIADAVRAICAVAANPKLSDGTPFLVGSGEGHSLEEAAAMISGRVEALFGRRVDILQDDKAELEPVEWREFIADFTRMREATGWTPKVKLAEGIDSTLRWLESGLVGEARK